MGNLEKKITSDRASKRDFSAVRAVAGDDVTEALKRIYNYIDGSALTDWLASLWEPSICACGKCNKESGEITCYGGAFYYSDSARDNEGFLPDVESTMQGLGRLTTHGAFAGYGNSFAAALPREIRDRIVRFVKSLQDEESGYFYHPQWGSAIGPSRRGRDLGWSLALLNDFGEKPDYPTALERLENADKSEKNATRLPSSQKNEAKPLPEVPGRFEDSLDSEESYLNWLYYNTQNLKVNTQGAHMLACVRSQVKAAGYLDITIDYLDQKLRENYEEMKAAHEADPENNPPPTGLWQKNIDYYAVWGLLKLYGYYNVSGRPLPYPVEAMRTCVAAVMIDPDEGGNYHMNDIFNMWGAAQRLINNVKCHNPELLPTLYEIARENAPTMIDQTIRKLAKFKQADETYGYCMGYSSPKTQGVPVSLGLPEGDVNAVALAMDTYTFIYQVLGIASVEVTLCTPEDGERFIKTIMEKTVKKTDV